MKKPIKVMSSVAFAALIAASSVNVAIAQQAGTFFGADPAGNLTKYPKAVVSANKAALKTATHRYFEPTDDVLVDYDVFIMVLYANLFAGKELQQAYTVALADPTVVAPAEVKAKSLTAQEVQLSSVSTVNVVNNTTVEVTLNAAPTVAPTAADFTFDNGLTAQSVTLKAGTTSTYTVTTSAQDTTKTYKLSYKGVDTGKTFTGVAVVDIKAVSAINKTTIKVEFTSNIDAVTVDNFAVSAGTIKTVSTPDPKTVLISVDGLNFQQALTVTVKGVKSGAATIADKTFNVTVPSVSDLYELKITTDATNDTITSDGATKTLLTATLTDKQTGLAVTGVNGIVKFVTTKGAVGQDEVAITNGVSTVQLTSAASDSPVTASVSATIIDAPSDRAYEGLIGTKVVTFAPAGTQTGTTTFVSAVSAEANQGDRFFVTFSGKISADAYKTAVAGDTSFGLRIDDAAPKVLNVVQKSDNVLEFVLDTDSTGSVRPTTDQIKLTTEAETWTPSANKNYLKDNTIHTIKFLTNVGSLVLANTTGINFIMTDAKRPFIYGVTPQDQLNFRVDTSESIAEDLAETVKDEHLLGDVRDNTSINTAFLIDGKKVRLDSAPTQANIDAAKAANEVIVNALYVGKYTSETDNTRNKIYFKLDPNFKLTAGTHQIQIANIGDWAGVVDNDNMVSTQTFDFTVTADTTKAVPSIEVQSPEQWLVSFTKPVASIATKTVNDAFKIYQADGYAKNPQEGQLGYGVPENPTEIPLTDKDYVITPIDDNGNAISKTISSGNKAPTASKFLIELTRDWTQIYTTSTSTVNYFTSTKNPYKVVIDQLEDNLQNAVDKTVLDVPLQYDGVSPTIVSAVDVYNLPDHKVVSGNGMPLINMNNFNMDNGSSKAVTEKDIETMQAFGEPKTTTASASGLYVFVTMSEPVQLRQAIQEEGSLKANEKLVLSNNSKPLTPSEKQVNVNGIPVPTFEFVKGDQVVQGHISTGTINEIDKNFIVEPDKPLEAGTWTLYIRSISDDVGNTSATVSSQVTVTQATSVSADTAIAWAAFDNNDVTNTDADKDYIYIKFTKVMDPTGASGVNNTTNYVFNGIQLPLGSQIYRGIKNVTDDWDGVTIEMPKTAFDGAKTNLYRDFTSVLNVANNFKAADGTSLVGPFEVQLTDTETQATTLLPNPPATSDFQNQDMNFEAVYHNTKGIILGNKAIEKAVATDVDLDGKIDTITLTLDGNVGYSVPPTPPTTTAFKVIKVTANANGTYTYGVAGDDDLQTVVVGGKTWALLEDNNPGDNVVKLVAANTAQNANTPTFTEAIAGTATTALTLTAANNNILINLGKVVDQAGPVATLSATTGTTNNATTLVATFTEPLYSAPNQAGITDATGAVIDGADITAKFTIAVGGSITTAIYNAANKTVTFTVANAVNGSTITVIPTVPVPPAVPAPPLFDKFGNIAPLKTYTYTLGITTWASN